MIAADANRRLRATGGSGYLRILRHLDDDDGNGEVGAGDGAVWAIYFGQTGDHGGGSLSPDSAPIAEPNAATLLAVLAAGIVLSHRFRR